MTHRDDGAAPEAPDAREPDCTECPLATRRRFLRDAAVAVAGIAASLGIARAAEALPIGFTSALASAKAGAKERKTYAIPVADGAQIDKDAQVILVRWQGAIYAFNLSCPHQNTALRWEDGNHRFQCPKHHSKYEPDGTFIEGRATRNMDRLAISRQGSNIVVDIDTMFQSDEDAKGWAGAVVKV